MKSMGEKALRFWTAYGKSVFLLLAAIFAGWMGNSTYENILLFWIGIGCEIITFFRLPYAYNEIKNIELRLAWAFIIFGLFTYISSALAVDVHPGFTCYSLGVLVAAIVCTAAYCYCSHINALLKLDKNFNLAYAPNGMLGWLIFFGLSFSFFVFTENEALVDLDFKKVEFVGVKKWDKEIYDGNTYYVVTTEDGKVFGVKPSKHPEIRNIHSGTKVKVLIDRTYTVYNNYSRLEIKN